MSTYFSQIAFVCKDARKLRSWYGELFGFLPSGRTIYAGKLSTRVMGIKNVNTRCFWSLDGNESMFQLEFFNFRSPRMLDRPDNWSPGCPGYTRLGIYTRHFQACVDALSQSRRLLKVEGEMGARIAYAADPEGNALEVYEKDPLPDAPWNPRSQPSAVRLIGLNSHHPGAVARWWTLSFGLTPVKLPVEWMWRRSIKEHGLAEPKWLRGGGVVVEICGTGTSFHRGRREPLYQHGLLNLAINTQSREEWDCVYNHALETGFRPNGKPLDAGIFKVMYINDPDGNSVELLYPRKFAYRATGFHPSPGLGVFARTLRRLFGAT